MAAAKESLIKLCFWPRGWLGGGRRSPGIRKKRCRSRSIWRSPPDKAPKTTELRPFRGPSADFGCTSPASARPGSGPAIRWFAKPRRSAMRCVSFANPGCVPCGSRSAAFEGTDAPPSPKPTPCASQPPRPDRPGPAAGASPVSSPPASPLPRPGPPAACRRPCSRPRNQPVHLSSNNSRRVRRFFVSCSSSENVACSIARTRHPWPSPHDIANLDLFRLFLMDDLRKTWQGGVKSTCVRH